MITPDTLPRPLLRAVAAQVGSNLLRLHSLSPSFAMAKTIELSETCSTWGIQTDFLAGKRTPTELFQKTGYWHQLAFDSKAAAFAQSTWNGDRNVPPRLVAFGLSPVVAQIDAALDWIDRHVQGDYELRLVQISAVDLHAIWLAGSDHRILTVRASDPDLLGRIEAEKLHGLDDLVDAARIGLANRMNAFSAGSQA